MQRNQSNNEEIMRTINALNEKTDPFVVQNWPILKEIMLRNMRVLAALKIMEMLSNKSDCFKLFAKFAEYEYNIKEMKEQLILNSSPEIHNSTSEIYDIIKNILSEDKEINLDISDNDLNNNSNDSNENSNNNSNNETKFSVVDMLIENFEKFLDQYLPQLISYEDINSLYNKVKKSSEFPAEMLNFMEKFRIAVFYDRRLLYAENPPTEKSLFYWQAFDNVMSLNQKEKTALVQILNVNEKYLNLNQKMLKFQILRSENFKNAIITLYIQSPKSYNFSDFLKLPSNLSENAFNIVIKTPKERKEESLKLGKKIYNLSKSLKESPNDFNKIMKQIENISKLKEEIDKISKMSKPINYLDVLLKVSDDAINIIIKKTEELIEKSKKLNNELIKVSKEIMEEVAKLENELQEVQKKEKILTAFNEKFRKTLTKEGLFIYLIENSEQLTKFIEEIKKISESSNYICTKSILFTSNIVQNIKSFYPNLFENISEILETRKLLQLIDNINQARNKIESLKEEERNFLDDISFKNKSLVFKNHEDLKNIFIELSNFSKAVIEKIEELESNKLYKDIKSGNKLMKSLIEKISAIANKSNIFSKSNSISEIIEILSLLKSNHAISFILYFYISGSLQFSRFPQFDKLIKSINYTMNGPQNIKSFKNFSDFVDFFKNEMKFFDKSQLPLTKEEMQNKCENILPKTIIEFQIKKITLSQEKDEEIANPFLISFFGSLKIAINKNLNINHNELYNAIKISFLKVNDQFPIVYEVLNTILKDKSLLTEKEKTNLNKLFYLSEKIYQITKGKCQNFMVHEDMYKYFTRAINIKRKIIKTEGENNKIYTKNYTKKYDVFFDPLCNGEFNDYFSDKNIGFFKKAIFEKLSCYTLEDKKEIIIEIAISKNLPEDFKQQIIHQYCKSIGTSEINFKNELDKIKKLESCTSEEQKERISEIVINKNLTKYSKQQIICAYCDINFEKELNWIENLRLAPYSIEEKNEIIIRILNSENLTKIAKRTIVQENYELVGDEFTQKLEPNKFIEIVFLGYLPLNEDIFTVFLCTIYMLYKDNLNQLDDFLTSIRSNLSKDDFFNAVFSNIDIKLLICTCNEISNTKSFIENKKLSLIEGYIYNTAKTSFDSTKIQIQNRQNKVPELK